MVTVLVRSWGLIILLAAQGVLADDLLIIGGTVVNETGPARADVRIRDEQIVDIGQLARKPGDREVIDATGKLLLPGGIDAHVHLVGEPNADSFADDFISGSRAALAGGITTLGQMGRPDPDELPLTTLQRWRTFINKQTIADVFVHTTIVNPNDATIAQLPDLAAAGQPSIKVFMPFPFFEDNATGFLNLLNAARDAGVVVAIHCEDLTTIEHVSRLLEARQQTSLAYYAQSRPAIAEEIATHRAVGMAEGTGATIYIVHLSSAAAHAATQKPRAPGRVFVETRPLYLHLTDERLARPDRGLYIGMPPLRSALDQASLWEGLANGTIDTIATDHAPWLREQKLDPRQTIRLFRAGVNNLQVMLPMLFSEGVNKDRLSLERFVAVTATNPARIFGLYPKKGTVAVGSDADIVIWDPSTKRTIRDEDVLSNTGFSIYAGTQVTGWPEITIRRGEVVYQDGKVTGVAGSGRLVDRTPSSGPS